MKIAYAGVMLDDPEALQQWWESMVCDLLPKNIAHHMTIKFRPSVDEVAALPLGEPVTLDVVGYANSGEIQTVVVRPHGVASANRIPHVTVATDGVTPPVKSNDLLAEGWTPVNGPTLHGRVGFFANGRDWFDLGVLGRTASVPLSENEKRDLRKVIPWAMDVEADGERVPPEIDALLHFDKWNRLTVGEARKLLRWYYSTAPGNY